jgi:carbamoyltransferase
MKTSSPEKTFFLGLDIDRINSSATLFEGTHVVAHVEEERFVRIKRAPGMFPINAIRYCLNRVPQGLNGVAAINLGFDHEMFTYDVPMYFLQEWSDYPTKPPEAVRFEKNYLKQKHPRLIRNLIAEEFEKASLVRDWMPPIFGYTHHYCHALCAHVTSPFERSLGIVVDGNSELDTYSVWDCDGIRVTKIFSKQLPNSIGWLYRTFTEFCGFEPNEGEGKLMGLAPFGSLDESLIEKVRKIISYPLDQQGKFDFDIDATFIYLSERDKQFPRFTKKFIDVFGSPANSDSGFQAYYQDVAYAIQFVLEEVLLRMARRFISETGHRFLTLSGGVALNCKVNGHIWQNSRDILEDIYIFPMSGDDGIGYGANLANAIESGATQKSQFSMESAFLGPSFSEEKYTEALNSFNLRSDFANERQFDAVAKSLSLQYSPSELTSFPNKPSQYAKVQALAREFIRDKANFEQEITQYTATQLSEGKIVAWFQGAMEAGPRALGNRSVLADPRSVDNRDRVNEKVKFRETWRPFCPSVLADRADEYFIDATQCPYMINTFHVTPKAKEFAPAIVHVDDTARPQFVTESANARFHKLIYQFSLITGVPILLNTSMNIKGEPICCTPDDALQFFFATDIDILVLGNYVLSKT